MGQINSTDTKTDFKTDVVNEVAQSFVSSITNSATDATYQNATIQIKLGDGATVSKCDFTATNKVSAETQALINTMAQKNATMTAEQTTKITNDIKKQIEQQNKALSLLPQNNVITDSVNLSNDIANKINQSYKSAVENQIGTFTYQNGVILFEVGKDFKCDESNVFLSNDLVSKTVTDSVLNSVDTFLSETNQSTDILNKYDLKVKQSNVGIDPTALLGIIAGILLLLSLIPLIMGGPILTVFKSFLIPLIMVAGYIGTVYFSINKQWILVLICLIITWVFFFMKMFSPSPKQELQTSVSSNDELVMKILNTVPS